ncbi:YwdI family protein [Bacillaceae bacterium Marseille-Q3522]|nr:YwdI family protein [Bacillaceae bacterium Marseille-Q3522]
MHISIHTLLNKIEAELQAAKTSASEAGIRERVHGIKTLCELILENHQGSEEKMVPNDPVSSQPIPGTVQPVQSNHLQGRKMDLGDEANGDSIFDF